MSLWSVGFTSLHGHNSQMVGGRRQDAEGDGGERRGIGSLLAASAPDAEGGPEIVELLHAVRTHLDMEVAFVSEFRKGQRVFRHVDSEETECPVRPGEGDPLEETYCQRVVDGRLPELIRDASALPEARALPVTAALPVGAHLSVPITLRDGTRYGTFCCFSTKPDLSLNERDLAMMRVFAHLAARRIDAEREQNRSEELIRNRLRDVLSGKYLTTVFQPIVDLVTGSASGYEALSRISRSPEQGPDVWFWEAERIGLGVDLDVVALHSALGQADSLAEPAYLSVNVTPSTITSGWLDEVFADADPARIVLEITEHAVVQNYDELSSALGPFRAMGYRISVDDAGAGYASLHHILRLKPEIIKLDMSLTRSLDRDPARRALAAAMVGFGAETGATIVAEGVETAEELATLIDVGVTHGQGYFLGRPGPLGHGA